MRNIVTNRLKELIYANFKIVEEEKDNFIVKDSLFKYDFSFKGDGKEIFIKCLIFDTNLKFLTIEKINLLNKESSKEKPINITIPRTKFDEGKVLFKCKELTITKDNKQTIKDICIVTKINRINHIKRFPGTWECVFGPLGDCIAYKQKGKLLFFSWHRFELVDIPEENIFSFISLYGTTKLNKVALGKVSKVNQNKGRRILTFGEETAKNQEYIRWRKKGYEKPVKSLLINDSTYATQKGDVPDGMKRFFYNFKCLLYNRTFEKNIGEVTFVPYSNKCITLPISFSSGNDKYVFSNKDSSELVHSTVGWKLYNSFGKLIFWVEQN